MTLTKPTWVTVCHPNSRGWHFTSTKFEVFTLSHSRNTLRDAKFQNGPRDPDHARFRNCYDQPEISRFIRSIRCKDMTVDAKCSKWGGDSGGWLLSAMSLLDRTHTSYSPLIETVPFSKYSEFLSKVTDFNPPHRHLALPFSGDPVRSPKWPLASKKLDSLVYRAWVLFAWSCV